MISSFSTHFLFLKLQLEINKFEIQITENISLNTQKPVLIRGYSCEYKDGLFAYGMCFLKGEGRKKNAEKGMDLIRLSSDKGYARANFELAWVFLKNDENIEQKIEGFNLLSKAENRNDPYSQFLLGTLYHQGIGTKKNDIKAVEKYHLAARFDHKGALAILSEIYKNGYYGMEKDDEASSMFRDLYFAKLKQDSPETNEELFKKFLKRANESGWLP